jgi:hypothetical protein
MPAISIKKTTNSRRTVSISIKINPSVTFYSTDGCKTYYGIIYRIPHFCKMSMYCDSWSFYYGMLTAFICTVIFSTSQLTKVFGMNTIYQSMVSCLNLFECGYQTPEKL